MQLNAQQLSAHLNGPLLPIYLISSDVPLLRQETRDAIRQAAQRLGYQAVQRLEVETGFHWSQLTQLAQSYNLFAESTLIELHNSAAKFDTEAGKTLLAYCAAPPADKLLLIITSKLTSAQQKTRWYQEIAKLGAVIMLWPVKAAELPQWIRGRLRQANLQADADSIRLLAELTEGNLLATQQAITKLRLLFPDQPIGMKEMASACSDNAQFNVFELSQTILQGDRRNVLRVLQHLRMSDTEPTLVLWLLARECRELLNRTAIKRPHAVKLQHILLACQAADQMIKGVAPGDPWNALTRIGLALAGPA